MFAYLPCSVMGFGCKVSLFIFRSMCVCVCVFMLCGFCINFSRWNICCQSCFLFIYDDVSIFCPVFCVLSVFAGGREKRGAEISTMFILTFEHLFYISRTTIFRSSAL